MSKPLDLTKPVQTRDGRAARILATDLKCTQYPVVGVLVQSDGQENVTTWTANGRVYYHDPDHPANLVNVPEKRTGEIWVNVFDNRIVPYTNKAHADRVASARDRLDCKRLTFDYEV